MEVYVSARPLITMNKVLRPLRRAAVYGSFSYLGLVVINNSGLDLPSLWIAHLPMFVGVYALTIWIDQIQLITTSVDREKLEKLIAVCDLLDIDLNGLNR